MPAFPAITHVALTVSDLQRSVSWYRQLFDKDPASFGVNYPPRTWVNDAKT